MSQTGLDSDFDVDAMLNSMSQDLEAGLQNLQSLRQRLSHDTVDPGSPTRARQSFVRPPPAAIPQKDDDAWSPGHWCLLVLLVLGTMVGGYYAAFKLDFIEDHFGLFGPSAEELWLTEASKSATSKTAGGGTKKALIINVTYKDTQTRKTRAGETESVELPGTVSDGDAMRKFLQAQGFMVTWMRDDECTHGEETCSSCKNATNEKGLRTYPNFRNIRDNMKGLARSSRPGDVLWIFFAGHGCQDTDEDGSEDDGKDEFIMPADYDLEGRYLTDDWFSGPDFRGAIDKKAETVAVFDCCHSGTMFDLPYTLDVDNDTWKRNPGQPDSTDDGFFLYLSGCQDAQTSAELRGRDHKTGKMVSHGAMTKNLTRMIFNNKLESSLDSFLEELREYVGQHMSSDNNGQKPNICCTEPFDVHKYSFKTMFDGKVPDKRKSGS